jgi:hypothetical protein
MTTEPWTKAIRFDGRQWVEEERGPMDLYIHPDAWAEIAWLLGRDLRVGDVARWLREMVLGGGHD